MNSNYKVKVDRTIVNLPQDRHSTFHEAQSSRTNASILGTEAEESLYGAIKSDGEDRVRKESI